MDSPLKWHGGKSRMAGRLWLLSQQIEHIHRVEVFGGSCAYTLACEPHGYSEVINDLNRSVSNFWMVLQHQTLSEKFIRACEVTPFSQLEWEQARDICHQVEQEKLGLSVSDWGISAVQHAHAFFVHVRQSMAARRKEFAALTHGRLRRDMNEQASAWLTAINGLYEVRQRLQRVAILCQDFSLCIAKQDSRDTLFYLDPTYLHSTRVSVGEYGNYEMTEQQHKDLIYQLSNIRGHFILSHYACPLYDDWAVRRGLTRIELDMPSDSGMTETKERKTEILYLNFKASL